MASEVLSILTQVQGAVQAARDIGKIGSAIDTIGTKASGLKGKLGGIAGSVGNFLSNTGIGSMIALQVIDFAAQAVRDTFTDVRKGVVDQTKSVTSTGREFLKSNPTIAELDRSIAGINQGIKDIKSDPVKEFLLGADKTVTELEKLRDEYQQQRDADASQASTTDSLLRANLAKPNPAPIVNVNVNANVTTTGAEARVQYTSSITSTNSYRGDPGYGR